MAARRYNCACGKKRYRDEESALAAAAADQRRYGDDDVRVYRCPGGLAWHLTAHGCTPGALPSVGRRLASGLLEHGVIDLGGFTAGLDPRRRRRAGVCAEQMTALGLVRAEEATGRLLAADRQGLARVVQIGLDAYAGEHRSTGG